MVIAENLKVTLKGIAGGGTPFTLECPHFRAEPGKITCIVGPNGSGKSTLVHMLSGRLEPDSGDVLLNGKHLKHLGKRERNLAVAWVEPGDTEHLVMSLRVQDHIAAALYIAGRPLPFFHRTLDAKTALEGAPLPQSLVKAVSELFISRIAELSSGQQQAIRLALCMLQGRKTIFTDESTSHLDVNNANSFFDSLKNNAQTAHATVIAVTHDLALAADYAQALYLVRDGRVTMFDITKMVDPDEKAVALRKALLA